MSIESSGRRESSHSSRHRRFASDSLNPPFLKPLLAYCSMATASIAGSASRAQAQVVYTPVQTNLHLDYYLDLNGDGINDFRIHSYYLSDFADLEVFALDGSKNKVVTSQYIGRTWAAALPAGAIIGRLSRFNQRSPATLAFLYSGFSYGPWVDLKNHYLGFAFIINGQKHFGWARLSFNSFLCYRCIAGITGYAYETVPGKAIIAGDEGQTEQAGPESATLGVLASGSVALSLWRKDH